MKYISFLIKPASSACDLRCSYCFYRDVADHRAHAVRERMGEKTAHALIDRALGLGDDAHVTFAFQGGEPTLAGLDFFREFTDYVDACRTGQTVRYALQTNGHALTPEWAEHFRAHGYLVGVSVDGPAAFHDALRKDIALGPTHARVMESVRLLCAAGVDFNVLTVLSAQLADHPREVFEFYRSEKIDYVQLIPCLAGLDGEGAEHALTPRAFFSFYRAFFDLWLREVQAGHVISVGLFDNIMQMSLGQYPPACGMLGQCAPQFVVEGNGDVYPCDFYALDEYRCGNIREDSLEELATCETSRAFLAEPHRACAACADCPFEGMCHRNCKRQSVALYDEKYCGYRAFLEYAYEPLARVARMLVSARA